MRIETDDGSERFTAIVSQQARHNLIQAWSAKSFPCAAAPQEQLHPAARRTVDFPAGT
ncbi:MAG: hypothetical protein HC895_24515, partial [Leptolyngbyaceae cyanobacterium SM1_3_5]|nr:hypothetical protein [Leptolyngbyaceae cyanobacterium SM1_3_5]